MYLIKAVVLSLFAHFKLVLVETAFLIFVLVIERIGVNQRPGIKKDTDKQGCPFAAVRETEMQRKQCQRF